MIGKLAHVTEKISRGAADRRQEDLQIVARHELREHAGGLLEQRTAQIRFRRAKPRRYTWKVPHRIDGDLDNRDTAVGVNDGTVVAEPAGRQRGLDLWQGEPGFCDCNAWADVGAFRNLRAEVFGD